MHILVFVSFLPSRAASMADRAAPGSDSGSPPAVPPVPQQDWEVLSLSMSASAFGASGFGPSAADPFASSGDDDGKAKVAPEGNPEAASESGGVAEVSEAGLPLGNWKKASPDSRAGDAKEKGKRTVSNSEVDSFAEGWTTTPGGNAPSDAIVDRIPVELDGFHTVSDTALLNASEDSFEQVENEGTAEAGLKKAVHATELGHGMAEGAGDVKSRSAVQGQKARERSLSSFCKGGFSATWEKWQASLLQARTPENTTLWSIALAATVMGLVVIGYRWQRERSQNQQLRMQLSTKDEKVNDLLHQVNRLREVMTGRRRVPVVARLSSG